MEREGASSEFFDMASLDDAALATELGLADEPEGDSEDGDAEPETPTATAPDEGDEEGTTPAGDESTATDGSEDEEEAEGEETSERDDTEAEPAKDEKPRELAIEFSVADAEGDLDVRSVADLVFTIPRKNGKPLKLTADKVARLAVAGVHNEEREARIDAALERERQVQAAIPQVRSHIEQLNARIDRLLADPEQYDREREEYERQNTPEERARRAEARANAIEQENARQARAAKGQTFLRETLAPKLDALLSSAATTEDGSRVQLISEDELLGRFTTLTARLRGRDGQIPPDAHERVLEIVENELAPWLEGLTATRLADREKLAGKGKAKADAATKRAQEAATLTKRRFVRPLTPAAAAAGGKAGSAQKTAANAGRKKPVRNAEESVDAILSELETEL